MEGPVLGGCLSFGRQPPLVLKAPGFFTRFGTPHPLASNFGPEARSCGPHGRRFADVPGQRVWRSESEDRKPIHLGVKARRSDSVSLPNDAASPRVC